MQPFQQKNSTRSQRYETFTVPLASWLAAERPNAKILSFGCSTGEEVLPFALMIADPVILGVDIDDRVLAGARRRYAKFKGLTFAQSEWPTIKAAGPFDIILANSVLCRHPESAEVDDLSAIFPFSAFDDTVSRLVDSLAPGGVLMVRNANYFVEDSSAGSALLPIESPVMPFSNGVVPKFNSDGRKSLIFHHYSVAVRDGDNRDPFARCRYSLFLKGKDKPGALLGLLRVPSYSPVKGGWIQEISMQPPQGWKVVPYERETMCVTLGNGSQRLLQQSRRKVDGKTQVIGEELLG